MKKIILTIIAIMSLSSYVFSQQEYYITQINSALYPISRVNDISFVDCNTGYLTAVKLIYDEEDYANDKNYVFKTTNGGNNWNKTWEYLYEPNSKKLSVSFSNANTGYISKRAQLLKTTNGGANFNTINTLGLLNSDGENVICANSNGDVYLIQEYTNKVFKYSSSGFSKIKEFSSELSIAYMELSKLNDNIIYVCGYNSNQNSNPFFAKSVDGGANWSIILNGSNPFDVGLLTHMSVTNNGLYDIVKISGRYKLIEYNNIGFNLLYGNWPNGDRIKISFGDPNNGYYLKYDGGNDDPPQDLQNAEAFRTTDGGQSWNSDLTISEAGYYLNTVIKFYSIGNVTYFTKSGGEYAHFYARKLEMNLSTFYDNISSNGSFLINSVSYNTPSFYYVRGGTLPIYSDAVLNSGQSNEKIFYRWNNNNMQNSIGDYSLINNGNLSTNYKTKLIADNASAISNPSATKSIRDKNGNINTIYESIGGIFYIKSTDNGTNFLREEIVNDNVYNLNGYSASGNTGPFISEIQKSDNIVANVSPIRNIVACWERRNGNSVEVLASLRDKYINGNYYWKKDDNNSITITSQDQSFKTHPKLFSVITNIQVNGIDTTFHQFKILTYLEPSTNGKKIKARGDYNNGSVSDLRSFDIEEGDMDDFSCVVQAGQFQQFDYDIGFILHYSYKKNGHIYYKKEGIFFSTNSNLIARLTPLSAENISLEDGQGSRYTSDISLRNGLPVIAWQGSRLKTRTIVYDQGNEETIITNQYPIIAKYKYLNGSTNGGTSWSTFIIYDSPSNVTQQNPNVEGSKNKNAFLINYSVNNSIFKQDVKFSEPIYAGYRCCPNTFPGVDAKLVRGSYIDYFGQNSNPMLLTLTQQSPSLYEVSNQPFTITNIPCNAISDNYTNLEGIVRDSNIYYYFNLGPIIVRNTFVSPEMGLDGPIYYTVQNPMEFNENMISRPFYLANGDTLILGGTGKYDQNPNEHFFIKKYNVGLFKQSDNQIQQLLFSDTINTCDTIESEYLRGFIINDISGGSDSFYVQLLIDSSDVSWGSNYSYSCVYSPDEVQGDIMSNYKSMVHFQNQGIKNNSNIPKTFSLSQNYPNPFNPATTIKYELPKDAFVTIKVYDIVGREIFTLVNENKQAGYYSVNFNGINFASGVYFYRIKAGDYNAVKRMVLIK
jgi:hypothetical protein